MSRGHILLPIYLVLLETDKGMFLKEHIWGGWGTGLHLSLSSASPGCEMRDEWPSYIFCKMESNCQQRRCHHVTETERQAHRPLRLTSGDFQNPVFLF